MNVAKNLAGNTGHVLRREDYKKVKKMDRTQFEGFCKTLYMEGFPEQRGLARVGCRLSRTASKRSLEGNMNKLGGVEMKFRIFDRIHKVAWVAGKDQHDTFHIWEDNQVSYYNYQTGEPSILPGEEMPDDGSGYILMRYTGKHDMSGTEVYEGDVVENPYGLRMEIRYGLYDAYCPADSCNMDSVGFYAVGEGLPEMLIGCLEDYAVVIGNVWENPELKVGESIGNSNQI